ISLASIFGWSHSAIGAFLAGWIILYGFVQGSAPGFIKQQAGGAVLFLWATILALLTAVIALGLYLSDAQQPMLQQGLLLCGLLAFAFIFAINSAYHSYLVVAYARADGASLDVGFYYMSNALGRLLGTVLSGLLFQLWGLEACLMVSALLLLCAGLLAKSLPAN
ncbi:MAG: MFS transporter, partial [Cellvibrionaceae bacterium]|nr:MFS transporter [Cellvibrionaceae bacterium]